MKNLFLAIAFLLIGTFAFANNLANVETVSADEAIEILTEGTTTSLTLNAELSPFKLALGICSIRIRLFNEDGETVYDRTIRVLVENEAECDQLVQEFEEILSR